MVKVVASLPIKGKQDLSKVKDISSDMMELRLDYVEDPSFILEELDYLRSFRDRVIFTIRSIQEGGVKHVNEEVKAKIYEHLHDLNFIVDVEAEFASRHKTHVDENTIVSCHYFNRIPDVKEIIQKFSPFEPSNPLFKVAVIGKQGYKGLLSSLLDIYPKIAVMPMGVNPMERIAFSILGSQLIYSSVDEPTAPGQMKYIEVRHILNCMGL
ncbi:type I 3-dehydroquinate dehydratase [Sulfuracidifex tepidarius]|uniref:3-dehydroquinate dehydratase n=1 Tax=Sulfuracidifex tepidarius TaxID=1294262 RepID=A0A510DVQ3_9CREN|nr:type I 3-dehydroquinate dehydratase [Sulfuracidifex tepidarius]BBG24254.1 3-dehydroquinate dehydratase [Sulfuracidifex tepidarius]BBG27011.1 3-dehydroquinate dehydratase [Sulfuracidifex tepidarius]